MKYNNNTSGWRQFIYLYQCEKPSALELPGNYRCLLIKTTNSKKKLTDQTNFREANDGRSLRREEVICSPDITISTYFLHLISFFFFLFCFYINWKCDFPLALSYGIVGSEKKGKQFRWCDFCCCCCRMRCDTFETLLDEINHWKVWN